MSRVGKFKTSECSCSALKMDLAGASLLAGTSRTSVLLGVGTDFSYGTGLGSSQSKEIVYYLGMVCSSFNTEGEENRSGLSFWWT